MPKRKQTLFTIEDGKVKKPSYQEVIPTSEFDLQSRTGQVLKETAGILRDVVKKRLNRFEKAGIVTPAVAEFKQSGTTLTTRDKRPSELRQDIRNMVNFLQSETGSITQAREIERKVLGRDATQEEKQDYWKDTTKKQEAKRITKTEQKKIERERKKDKKINKLFWDLMHRVDQLPHSKNREKYERVREIVMQYAKDHPRVTSDERKAKIAVEIDKILQEEFEKKKVVPWATIKTRLK